MAISGSEENRAVSFAKVGFNEESSIKTFGFLKEVVDSVSDHIAVIDHKGNICFTNRAWGVFAERNECAITQDWRGVNYLAACDKASKTGDELAVQAATGIRQVIDGADNFYYEYPCHGPSEQRWFMMRVTPLNYLGVFFIVISHQNITERKIAEEAVLALSRIDGLTGLANRRHFDEFLREEWRRCLRQRLPVSLAMVDLDHFKTINDTHGHQRGDDCLVAFSKVIAEVVHRPGDLCARYGGEEFALVLGNSTTEQVLGLIDDLMERTRVLRISSNGFKGNMRVTASIGLATMYPDRRNSEEDLLSLADRHLLTAKSNGRNQVVWG